MNTHHTPKDRRHAHHGHGGAEAPARTFWTRKRVAITAVVALAAMAVFVFLTACEKGPAPRGPEPIASRPAAPGAPSSSAGAGDKAASAAAAGVPMPPSGAGAPAGVAGAAAAEAESMQAGGYPVSGPEGDQTMIEVGGLRMPKPVTWVWTKPSMQFRALQYAVPANGVNAPAAELVFSVFAGGDGGPIDANLDRWANQFRDGDAAAKSVRTEATVSGMRVLRIESVGAYMGMGAAAPRPGQMQLGAIVEAPGRNVFIKLVGPQATVESNRAAFDALIAGMK
ncbi:MAG: hypothetical protein ACKOTD_01775 [Phycisphaerales bacterium]